MISCGMCAKTCTDILTYVRHMRTHSCIPNASFKCVFPGCHRTFQKFRTFKSHSYRHCRGQSTSTLCSVIDLTCHVGLCSTKCENTRSFYSHLRVHIRERKEVACPFRNCDKRFKVQSSFSSHISRKHKKLSEKGLMDYIVNPSSSRDTGGDSDMQIDDPGQLTCEQSEVCPEAVEENQFFRNLAMFYLKLQAKFLLPASVIQTIIEDYQQMHDLSQSDLLFKLKEKLVNLGIAETDIENVIDTLKCEDLFRKCNTEKLKSDQRRKNVFKTNFHYVEPKPICLGQNESGKECFVQYIPIKETVASLLQTNVFEHWHSNTNVNSQQVLRDVWDGTNIENNKMFEVENSLGLILYQDAFEVVNPLGSGKKTHKVLAVYATLANILPHNRSKIDHMQLVLLCKEQDFKYFGQELMFGPLIKDLKDLETSGITMPDGKTYKGTVCAIAGDNLGSHCIGGFTENFSKSLQFCRYCEIDRTTFLEDPLAKGQERTKRSYQEHAQTQNVGFKFDSFFNELTHFHVCQPGLPPCLGHDLFEGIVSSDLALYIKHLVTVEKQLTYLDLNRRITQFKYFGRDASNKPCEVNPGAEKLSGHAVQNWCFLRMLPVLISEKWEIQGTVRYGS